MNPWEELLIKILVFGILIITLMIGIILIMVKKYHKRNGCIILSCSIIFLLLFTLFISSHQTNFKYNDWAIINQNITAVEQKYGTFDIGEVKKGIAGTVGYYLYENNGPIMPDYLEHYYYMEYDENGIIYKVYDGCRAGG